MADQAHNPPDGSENQPSAEIQRPDAGTVSTRRQYEVRASYSGPLPPPAMLKEYDQVVPGGAERIFSQFEKQSQHRQSLEAQVVRSELFNERLGVLSAAVLGLIGVAGGILLIYAGKDVSGLTALIGTLATLAGVFIIGKRLNSEPQQTEEDDSQ